MMYPFSARDTTVPSHNSNRLSQNGLDCTS